MGGPLSLQSVGYLKISQSLLSNMPPYLGFICESPVMAESRTLAKLQPMRTKY